MRTERGSLAFDPGRAVIDQMLASLDRTNWFALLERPDDWYIQVGRHGDQERWHLEYRERSPDRHFQTEVDAVDALGPIFEAFARGDYAWRADFAWRRLDFE